MKLQLFDLFPVPKFLSMETSGVAISDGLIQFVICDTKSGRVKLDTYGEIKLADDVISQGSVVKTKELISTLSEFKKKHNLKFVQVSIPEEKSFLFKTFVYGKNLKEITNNIELQIPDNVPYPTSEVVFDFMIIQEHEDQKTEVMVSVLPKSVVLQYMDVFRAADLVPTSFQVESQAVAEAIISDKDCATELIVNIHGDKAGFYIVSDGVVRFSSTSSISEREFNVNVLDVFKKDDSLGQKNLPILLREIKKIMTYWRTHDGADDALKKIIFCGSIKNEIELTDYIGSNVSTPAEIANVWVNAFNFEETIPDMPRKDSLRFAAAVGMTLLK